jgi:hypothetical protein
VIVEKIHNNAYVIEKDGRRYRCNKESIKASPGAKKGSVITTNREDTACHFLILYYFLIPGRENVSKQVG